MSSNIRVQRVCQQCGDEFTAKTTVTKFCGDICAKRAYKQRKRDEKITESNVETAKVIALPILEVQSKEFLSIADACLLLGISRQTIWRAMKAGRIEPLKLRGRRVLRRGDIDRLFS